MLQNPHYLWKAVYTPLAFYRHPHLSGLAQSKHTFFLIWNVILIYHINLSYLLQKMKLKLEIQLCIKYLASNHIWSLSMRKKCMKWYYRGQIKTSSLAYIWWRVYWISIYLCHCPYSSPLITVWKHIQTLHKHVPYFSHKGNLI